MRVNALGAFNLQASTILMNTTQCLTRFHSVFFLLNFLLSAFTGTLRSDWFIFFLETSAGGMSDWRLVHPYKCLSSLKHHLFLSSPPKTLRPSCAPTFYVFTFCQQYLQAIGRMSDNVYVGTNFICTLSEICCPFLFDSGETINDRRFDVSVYTIYSDYLSLYILSASHGAQPDS